MAQPGNDSRFGLGIRYSISTPSRRMQIPDAYPSVDGSLVRNVTNDLAERHHEVLLVTEFKRWPPFDQRRRRRQRPPRRSLLSLVGPW